MIFYTTQYLKRLRQYAWPLKCKNSGIFDQTQNLLDICAVTDYLVKLSPGILFSFMSDIMETLTGSH